MKATTEQEYYDAKWAASYLKVNRNTIYRWARKGWIGSKLGSRTWRFTREECDAFAQGRYEHESR